MKAKETNEVKNEVTNEVKNETNEVKTSKIVELEFRSYSKKLGENKCNISFKSGFDAINADGENIVKYSAFIFDSQISTALSLVTPYFVYFKTLNDKRKNLYLFGSKIQIEIVNYCKGVTEFLDYQGAKRKITAENTGTSVRLIGIQLTKDKLKEFESKAEEYLNKQESEFSKLESEMLLGIKKREE